MERKDEYTRRIVDLMKEDRPREKALAHGMQALTTAELLAILLGSGSRGESVIDLSQRILNDSGNRLSNIAKRSVRNLMKSFKGVGEAKAITLLAAIELGKRYREEDRDTTPVIRDPGAAYDLMHYQMEGLPHEEFWAIYLNNAKRVIDRQRISSGGIAATVVDVKILIKYGIENLATAMILVHNHPSGNIVPSRNDDELTARVKNAAKLVDIDVVDHIIIGEKGYYSYTAEGRL